MSYTEKLYLWGRGVTAAKITRRQSVELELLAARWQLLAPNTEHTPPTVARYLALLAGVGESESEGREGKERLREALGAALAKTLTVGERFRALCEAEARDDEADSSDPERAAELARMWREIGGAPLSTVARQEMAARAVETGSANLLYWRSELGID